MNKIGDKQFNDEINRYKYTLRFCAKICEWETFKVKAGKLFDYVESIEMMEIEHKFFKISKVMAAILFLFLVVIFQIDPAIHPEYARFRELLILTAIAGCCFEVYFFFNFRMYMKGKTLYYTARKEDFIRNIEEDFRGFTIPGEAAQEREETTLVTS